MMRVTTTHRNDAHYQENLEGLHNKDRDDNDNDDDDDDDDKDDNDDYNNDRHESMTVVTLESGWCW